MNKTKRYLTYIDIENAAFSLAPDINRLAKKASIKILTFTKGGLFASGYLCNYLDERPDVISIGKSSSPPQQQPGETWIVVDDILDTGRTVNGLGPEWTNNFHVFLVETPGSHRAYTPRRYSYSIAAHESEWIVFPWELP